MKLLLIVLIAYGIYNEISKKYPSLNIVSLVVNSVTDFFKKETSTTTTTTTAQKK